MLTTEKSALKIWWFQKKYVTLPSDTKRIYNCNFKQGASAHLTSVPITALFNSLLM